MQEDTAGKGPELVLERDGVPIVMPCFGIVLYTREILSQQAAAVLQAFDRFLSLVPREQLGMYRTETMPKRKPVTPGTLKLLETWLKPGAPKREFIALHLNTGRQWNETTQVNFSVLGVEPGGPTFESGDANWIYMTLPLAWMADRLDELEAEARRLFASLPFVSGTAGPMLELTIYDRRAADQFVWPTVMRYRGFEAIDPFADAEAVKGDGLRSVNWLTFLGQSLAEEFGGAAGLARAVGPGVDVQGFGQGVCLKAGPRPGLGDWYAHERLTAYEAVFRACEPAIDRMSGRLSSMMLASNREENTLRLVRRLAYEDA